MNASNPNQANVTLQANLVALLRGHDESNLFNPTITIVVYDNTHFYNNNSLVSYMPNSSHPNSDDNFSKDKIPFKHFESFAHDLQDSYSVKSENKNYSEEDLFTKVNVKQKFSKSSLDETMKSKKTFSPRVSFSVTLFSLVLSWAILLRNKLATIKTYLLYINQAHLDKSFGIGLCNMEQWEKSFTNINLIQNDKVTSDEINESELLSPDLDNNVQCEDTQFYQDTQCTWSS